MLDLKNHLVARKLDPTNEMDRYIADSCRKDIAINSYILCDNMFRDTSYLKHSSVYQSQYGIYLEENPIGYLDISKIYITSMDIWVELAYAILKEYRRKGYAKKVVKEVTSQLLNDTIGHLKSVHLEIASDNVASISTAQASGFIENNYDFSLDCKTYIKTKLMDEKEKAQF